MMEDDPGDPQPHQPLRSDPGAPVPLVGLEVPADAERPALVAQLTASLRRSAQLLDLTQALATTLTLGQVADTITEHTRASLGTLFAGVALLDEERRTMRFVSMSPLPADVVRTWTEFTSDASVPAVDAVRRGQPLLHPDRAEILEAYPHIAEDLDRAGTEAMASLPLVVSGRTIGTLQLTWGTRHVFDEGERRFLATLAGQAAQAVARAELFARQHSVAMTLQQAFLPQRLPTVRGLSLAARYEPAGHGVDVGGDWYDAFELPQGPLVIVVGDVGGHGLPAAAVMGQLRNAARAYALDGHGPRALVTRLNRLLVHSDEATLATVVCATVDPGSGVVRWSSAGHPPPLLLDTVGSASLLERVHGPLLGVDAHRGFAESCLVLDPGTSLLFYTDGLVEHRTRAIGAGLEQLLSVASGAGGSDLEEFCDHVVSGVLADGPQEDDLCMLAVRRVAPSP